MYYLLHLYMYYSSQLFQLFQGVLFGFNTVNYPQSRTPELSFLLPLSFFQAVPTSHYFFNICLTNTL
jgi:hypothetical protein